MSASEELLINIISTLEGGSLQDTLEQLQKLDTVTIDAISTLKDLWDADNLTLIKTLLHLQKQFLVK
ncbi:MAG: hypothetical protein FWH54_00130 [Methanobrevibacter sp.]|nr:hypothetical protein [Methanobrevibacter sp.]